MNVTTLSIERGRQVKTERKRTQQEQKEEFLAELAIQLSPMSVRAFGTREKPIHSPECDESLFLRKT